MRCLTVLIAVLLLLSYTQLQEKKAWKLTGFAQGTSWHISYYSADSLISQFSIDSILSKLDSSLSIYKPYSLINQFNNASDSIQADEHLSKVVQASLLTYSNTNGIFDITIQPLTQAWGFGTIKLSTMPDSLTVFNLKQCVDSRYLTLQGSTLIKQKPCVKIDVNGIAQGYSVDVLADFLETKGIRNYMVELGGEIRLRGRKYPGAIPMTIGIEAPSENPFEQPVMQKLISRFNCAVTTSGSYRKFRESGGKKISHIINAQTGFPASNELISVTVLAKRAITADAYDNALMVMGLTKALQFLELHPELAAYFIYRQKDGSMADTASANFDKFSTGE